MAERSIVINHRPADVDVAGRILRGVQFATRSIARDGHIAIPSGLRSDKWEASPDILVRHAMAQGSPEPQNIGRGIRIDLSDRFGVVDVQFADDERGREYAYLYGVNEKREVYARGWSYSWDPLKVETWSLTKARSVLGADYDEELVPPVVRRAKKVVVHVRGLLTEISVTPRRADLDALTRAYHQENIREAGRLVQSLQFEEISTIIIDLKREREVDRERIAVLEEALEIQRGEVPSPAALGDSEGVLESVRELLRSVKQS